MKTTAFGMLSAGGLQIKSGMVWLLTLQQISMHSILIASFVRGMQIIANMYLTRSSHRVLKQPDFSGQVITMPRYLQMLSAGAATTSSLIHSIKSFNMKLHLYACC